jgi:hypothetical protein
MNVPQARVNAEIETWQGCTVRMHGVLHVHMQQ